MADEEEVESEESEDQDGEAEDEQQDEHDEGEPDPEAEMAIRIAGLVEDSLGERFDAVADRRVNALLKEIRKQQGKPDDQKAPKGEAPSSLDVRAARLAAREYLSDEIVFDSAEERKMAMELVSLEIAAHDDLDDEDEVGREVAAKVAKRVEEARRMYDKKTKSDLKRRGALKDKPGQPKRGPGATSASSEFAKGSEIARRFRPVEDTA